MSGETKPKGEAPRSPAPAAAFDRAGVIAAWSGIAFVVAYAALRLVAAAFYPEPNPAIIVSSESVAYFQRLQLCAFVAGMVAIGLWNVAPERISHGRLLPEAVWVAFGVIALQSVIVP